MVNHGEIGPTFVFGLGSPHGDDQLGWLVARLLGARQVANVVTLRNVDQLLEYFPDCGRAVIVDSCVSGSPVGSIFQFRWPDSCIVDRRQGTTHGMDVDYVLGLAEQLGTLPREVLIYAVEIRPGSPAPEISSAVAAAANEVAERIERELAVQATQYDA